MTGKRFSHKEDDWEILDNGEHLAYAHSDYQAEKICEVLNELNNENKQLKQQIHYLKIVCRNELDEKTLKQVMGSLSGVE